MNVLTPFHTPIWHSNINIDFEKAIKTAQEIKKTDTGRIFSNRGGYQSNDIELNKFFPEIFKTLLPLKNNLSEEIETDLTISNSWLNINVKENYNLPHTHALCSLSAVIYLQTHKDSGKIIFKNPTLVQHYPLNNFNKHFYNTFWILPIQGNVIIFPSFLEHYVEENKSDVERISIAINFIGKGK